VELKETEILRIQPKQNDFVNRVWLSDRARFSFDGYKNQRLTTPYLRTVESTYIPLRWKKVTFVLRDIGKFLIFKQSLVNRALFTKIVSFSQLFSKLAVVCSNSLAINDLFMLNQNCSKLGIKTFGHSGTYAPVSELDSVAFFGCELSVSFLPKTEVCILIGTNPRFEAAVFNIQLRKRFTFGLFKIYSAGVPHSPTFAITFTGVSTSFFIKLGEGSSKLCKEVTTKASAIIAGSNIFKRIDRTVFKIIFASLKKVTNIGSESILKIGFLNREVNAVGAALCGIQAVNKEELNNASVVYLVGEDHNTDTVNSLIADPSKFLVYQGAHNQFFTTFSTLILPTTSLLEASGGFFSFEGRAQKSNRVSNSLGESKSHLDVYTIVSSSLLEVSAGAISINFFTSTFLSTNFANDSLKLFVPQLNDLNTIPTPFIAFSKNVGYTNKQRFVRTPYSASVSDFYLTSALTRASKLMVKCSQTSRFNHKNFIAL